MPRVRKNGSTGNSSSNPNRVGKKPGQRTKATINRLNMYKAGAPVRNRQGKIVGGDLLSKFQTGNKPMEKMARIAPNRKWFGNTRTISQKELESFREQMSEKVNDPYTVVLNQRKLPMGLLSDSTKTAKMNLLSAESYESVFGPKKQRKRAKISSSTLEALVQDAGKKAETFVTKSEEDAKTGKGGSKVIREEIFSKGQSPRIWQELYKVLDCSDVVLQILDARDPLGTRSKRVEDHLKKNAKHKHLVFVLNKCDLVPTWVTRRWVRLLSEEYPTLAFHAHLTKPFGKGALIQLLRQFALLHPEKKQISVGLIGYPNAGKSSIINALRSKKVCKVAPIPGETKIWQYVTLFKRVFLIDCPGVVYPNNDTESEIVMKGVVRAERLETPEDYVPDLMERVDAKYLSRIYGIDKWESPEDFMTQLAVKRGRLLKHGEPDFRSISQRMIYDLQRGRIPYFVAPPAEDSEDETNNVGGRSFEGLGEIPMQDFNKLPQKDFLKAKENDDDEDEIVSGEEEEQVDIDEDEEEEEEEEEDEDEEEEVEEKEKEKEKEKAGKGKKKDSRKRSRDDAKKKSKGKASSSDNKSKQPKTKNAKKAKKPTNSKKAAGKLAWDDMDL